MNGRISANLFLSILYILAYDMSEKLNFCNFNSRDFIEKTEVNEKINELLDDYNKDFTSLLYTLIDIGSEKGLIDNYSVQSMFNNEDEANKISKFNTTQALKRFCRRKYKEDPYRLTKPPKNSDSKSAFVIWAKQNNIDISHFRTRSYQKRSFGSFSSQNESSEESSETDHELMPPKKVSNSTPTKRRSLQIQSLLN